MSTRATYQIISNENFNNVDSTFYIHHDGYPEYAFNYFQNAINNERGGSFADKFHAANERAEITTTHDDHGDTEFEYTLTVDEKSNKTLIAASRGWDGADKKEIFNGPLEDFIKKYK